MYCISTAASGDEIDARIASSRSYTAQSEAQRISIRYPYLLSKNCANKIGDGSVAGRKWDNNRSVSTDT